VRASSPSACGSARKKCPISATSTPPSREQLHQPVDDGLQQGVQLVVGGRPGLDEARFAIGTAPVHAVQHQAVSAGRSSGRLSRSAGSA
jgi:hypothetical protein